MMVFDNIVFDLQQGGGISVVWYELLKRLMADAPAELRFIDNHAMDNGFRHLLPISASQVVGHDRWTKLSRYLPVSVPNDGQRFLFHSSYYRYCTDPRAVNVTTVHDFTYELYRSGIQKRVHCWQKYHALRRSAAIVCVSENTKRDLLRFVPDMDERRIHVVYNGVSEDYRRLPTDRPVADLPFPSGRYVLFVGSRFGYKNFDFVCRGLAQSDYHLVIVGSELSPAERRLLDGCLPPSRYQCLGFVTNDRLNELYNHAAALAYPSSYEGFGIPVLEAQRAGCPVIAYRASSIPEVIGQTPLLMDELSEHAFHEKLQLLSRPDLMAQVREEGLRNAARFSWDAMYQEYVAIYESLLQS